MFEFKDAQWMGSPDSKWGASVVKAYSPETFNFDPRTLQQKNIMVDGIEYLCKTVNCKNVLKTGDPIVFGVEKLK